MAEPVQDMVAQLHLKEEGKFTAQRASSSHRLTQQPTTRYNDIDKLFSGVNYEEKKEGTGSNRGSGQKSDGSHSDRQ